MALSNMLREPRREITETVIGAGLVGGFLFGDYSLARFLGPILDPTYASEPIVATFMLMLLGFGVIFVSAVAVSLTHFFGEQMCNALGRRGLDPRPVRRV